MNKKKSMNLLLLSVGAVLLCLGTAAVIENQDQVCGSSVQNHGLMCQINKK